jgi:hypothetical protein
MVATGVDIFPIIGARGSAYLAAIVGGSPFLAVARLGGAIKAARGSFDAAGAGAGVEGALSLDLMIGGGANGLATSAGSSPGKIQRFNFYEKKKNIYEDLSNFSML